MKKDKRIPVIIAVADGISGVMSWASRLKSVFKNHSRYNILLLGCRAKPNADNAFDFFAPDWKTAYEILHEIEPAIIVPNFIFDLIEISAELISQGKNIRCIGFCRADTDEEYYNPLSWYEPLISTFIAVSPECAEKLTERIPFRAQNIEVLPTGVSVPEKLKRNYQNKPLRIIYAGRIVQKQKRAMDFVPLVKNLLSLNVDFVFDIVGGGSELLALKEAMLKIEHHGRVRFHDRVASECMDKIWSEHDVFIQTSDFEGTSNSMLEAMAQGMIPLVTRTKSGVDGVIEDGKNGFVVPIGDMKAIAEKIKFLASHSEKIQKIGRNAYITSKKYSIDSYAEKFENILNKTLQSPLRTWPAGKSLVPETEVVALTLPREDREKKSMISN